MNIVSGVVGAGGIGGDMAYAMLMKLGRGDDKIVLVDIKQKQLDSCRERHQAMVAKAVSKGKMTQDQGAALLGRIVYTLDYDTLATCRLVVESATEDLGLKQRILHDIEVAVSDGCVIGFTSSSLRWDQIAADALRPGQCWLMHPFFRAWQALPLEVCNPMADEAQTRLVHQLAIDTMGKVPIPVGDSTLLGGNAIFLPIIDAAVRMLEAEFGTVEHLNVALARTLGGGGAFLVHDYITRNSPGGLPANVLSYGCLERMYEEVLFGAIGEAPTRLHDQGSDPWLPDFDPRQMGKIEIDDALQERVRDRVLGLYCGMGLNLVENQVISPFWLDWLCRQAFQFRVGPIQMANELGVDEMRRMWGIVSDEGLATFKGPDALVGTGFGESTLPTCPNDVQVEIRDDGVAMLTVTRPEALNALSSKVIAEMGEALNLLDHDERVDKGVVFQGWNGTLAGADVKELVRQLEADDPSQAFEQFPILGQQLTLRIEAMSKPVVFAGNGLTLGGGSEFAQCCWARSIGPKTVVGQPEVNLGIIPGFGATQRLAVLVGVKRALEMLRTGRPINAQTALEYGWADVLTDNPLETAIALIHQHADPDNDFQLRPMDPAPMDVDSSVFDVDQDIGHLSPAVDKILVSAVQLGLAEPLDQALAIERQMSGQVAQLADCGIGLRNFMTNGPHVKAKFTNS